MTVLPQAYPALIGLALGLGLRHGIDADHLAAIDSLVRLRRAEGSRWAPLCGLLFSLGHGAIVLVTAAVVNLAATAWQPPHAILLFGEWSSVLILVFLGASNLWAVVRAPVDQAVAPAGWRSGWMLLRRASHPAGILAIGALFALSFDTLSLASLFGLAALNHGGLASSLAIATVFALGMIAVDGINGWWVARLVQRADRRAARASRIATSLVAIASLAIGLFGAARLTVPDIESWGAARDQWLGLLVIAWVGGGCALAGIGRRRLTQSG